jgi:hypothetical protein
LIRVEVDVTGVGICTALMDSGARKGFISERLLTPALMQQCDKTRRYQIKALGEDSGIESVGTIDLSLRLSDLQMRASFVIVPAACKLNADLVCGTEFLENNNLELFGGQRRLIKQYDCGAICDIYIHESGTCQKLVREVLCLASFPVEVNSGEQASVQVTLDVPEELKSWVESENTPMYFQPIRTIKSLSALPGIVDSQNLGVIVTNCDANSKIVGINQVVGVVSSVVEVLIPDHAKHSEINVTEKIDVDHLDDASRSLVYKMFDTCAEVLSENSSDIGLAKVTAHEINLHDDTPIYQRPRRFPEPVTQEIEKQCQELYSMDIIEPSSSPWSSPVVPIRKKDGTLRLCVDYRRLNRVTKPDRYPLPNLVDSVYALRGNKFFTVVDLVRGYYQVPVHENSREYTAFSTPHAH